MTIEELQGIVYANLINEETFFFIMRNFIKVNDIPQDILHRFNVNFGNFEELFEKLKDYTFEKTDKKEKTTYFKKCI